MDDQTIPAPPAEEEITQTDHEVPSVPPGDMAPEERFAVLVGHLLDDRLGPLRADISMLRNSLRAMRDEFRGRLRSHDTELDELRDRAADAERRLSALEAEVRGG